MKILKYRNFSFWSKTENITDAMLILAIEEIKKGLFEANLGGGLYKKRISRKGQGKKRGYRTLIAYQQDERVIFMYGFAKNERENISNKEKEAYKKLAKYYLTATDIQLKKLVQDNELIEVILCQN